MSIMATRRKPMAELIRTELLGLPVLQIAKRAGLNYAVAHAFMRGTADPKLTTVEKLAELAGLELVKRKGR